MTPGSNASQSPPRLAEALLRRSLPPGPVGASILGDLAEEYHRRSGGWRQLWYWSVASWLASGYMASQFGRALRHWTMLVGNAWRPRHVLTQDVRFAFRAMRKRPGFALVAVLTIALGVGTATAMFSVVNAVMLRPLGYHEPDRLVSVWPHRSVTEKILADLEQDSTFAGVTAVHLLRAALEGDGQPEEVQSVRVAGNHFAVLGVAPVMGRGFELRDQREGAPAVAILSHGLWQRRYGGDTGILGGTVLIAGNPHTVVGILPAAYQPIFKGSQLWLPISVDPTAPSYDGQEYLDLIGRLAAGTSVEQADAVVKTLGQRLRSESPERYDQEFVDAGGVRLLREELVGEIGPLMWVLLGAVGLVLLIACANIGNLLLARAGSRESEFAMRLALGADQRRVIRQLLTESVVLGMSGGALGVVAAGIAIRLFANRVPADLPLTGALAVDPTVLLFALAITLGASLLFGLVPALKATRPDLNEALKAGSRSSLGSQRHRLNTGLVVAEMALAVVLVAGAGLMLKGLWRLHRVDPGFDASRVATFRVSVTPARYPGKPQIKEFIHQASERLAALPGVEAVGAIQLRPLTDREFNFTYVAEDHAVPPGVPAPAASLRITIPGYFRAMGIPLIEGRDFDGGTDDATAGIINERMATELWPMESAIGKRINLWSPDGPEFSVVGVVGTVRQQRVDTEGTPEMYLPHERFTSPTMTFTVRTAGAPALMIPELKQAVWSVDDGIPISEIATMEEVVSYSLADARFFAGLLAAFGILALGLGALGVYGVLAYSVSERRHEIGVRIALGAARGTVQRWVVARGLLPVGLGLGLGMLTSLWATRLLAAHLYQVETRDLSIFGGVALTLLMVALLATWLPARRASRVDPIEALRTD